MQDFERLLSEIDKRNELLRKEINFIVQINYSAMKLNMAYNMDIQRLLHELLAIVSQTDIEGLKKYSSEYINAICNQADEIGSTSKFSLDELLAFLLKNREN